MSFSEHLPSTTTREKVTPLPQKSTTALPAPPIEAIRQAVRAEMEVVHQTVTDAAIRTAASAVVDAQMAATRGVLIAITSLLAVRLVLLLALLGAFVLAVMALRIGTYQADGVLVAYAVLVVIPFVWRDRHTRIGSPPEGAR